MKTAAALRPRSGAQRARNGHHLDRHILPRGFDFATTPSFRRRRPPGALQAAAPSAEPCRARRARSSPLPRSRRQVQASRRAPMAVERQRKVVGLQLPSCLHCCLTCRRRLTMRLQSVASLGLALTVSPLTVKLSSRFKDDFSQHGELSRASPASLKPHIHKPSFNPSVPSSPSPGLPSVIKSQG